MRPSRSDSWASAASSGSTPITRASGHSALTAVETPEIKPPPPTQTTTVATSGRSCAISSPTVPWPAMIRASSNGGMYSSERVSRISAATRWRSSLEFAQRTISAPNAAVRATFTGAAFSGITIVAGTPCSAAAAATPCAWFPLESATTPRSIAANGVDASALNAPRNLNEPVRWRLSGLT